MKLITRRVGYIDSVEIIKIVTDRISGAAISGPADFIFCELRTQRVIRAAFEGASFARAGAGVQVLVGSPIADPSALGLWSGAGGAAALSIIVGVATVGAFLIFSRSVERLSLHLPESGTLFSVDSRSREIVGPQLVSASTLLTLGEDTDACGPCAALPWTS